MKSHWLVAACLVVLPLAASAQALKPGLWEITQTMDDGGELAQAMAEMRKEM